MVQLVVPGNN